MTRDRAAQFEAVARSVVEPLRRYLLRRTDPDTAADVLSDVLLVLWRRLDELPEETDSALAWSYGIARGCLANANRAHGRQQRLLARIIRLDPPAQVTDPEPVGAEPRVHRALAGLPERDRELLRLWAWEDLDPAGIAVALDISVNAVNIRLHRARARLQQLMTQDGSGGPVDTTEGFR